MKKTKSTSKGLAALRRAAEKRLKAKPAISQPSATANLRRVQHELEVHQIELEMQNEELRAAQVSIEAALERYTDFFEFAPVGYFNLSAGGVIRLVNLTGAKLVGVARSRLLNRNFSSLVAESDRRGFGEFLARVFATKLQQDYDLALVAMEGSTLFVHLQATASACGPDCRVVVLDQTERKCAEVALRRNLSLLQAVTEGTSDAIFAKDRSGRYCMINSAGAKFLGLSPESVIGKTDTALFGAETARTIWAGDLSVIETGQIHQFEEQVTVAGDTRTYLSSKAPWRDTQGNVIGLVGISHDITARIERQNSLRESEERFRAVFEKAAVGICLVGKDFCFKRVNPRFCEILGYVESELINSGNCVDTTHPDDRAGDARAVEQLQRGAASITLEKRYLRKDRRVVWACLTLSALRAASGEVQQFIGIVEDITERKRTEEAIRESEQQQRKLAEQLERERARLVAAQVVAKVGSWETDLAIGTVNWSEETYRIFATDPGTFQPTHQGFLELVHPEDRVAVDQAFIRSFDKRYPCAIEHRVLQPEGEIKFVEERWQVFHDAEGKPIRAIGTCQDITERKHVEKQLRALTARLQSLREEERIRISREIHDELGQKLTGLKMDLHWLESRLPQISDEKLRPAMEEKLITASTTADETMITVQRIAAELRPAMLDSLGLISTLRYEAKQFEGRTGIPVILNLPADLVTLDDKVATTTYRVFQEVLTNVARHAQATKVQAALEISAGKLRLSVEDNGIGVSPEDLLNPKSLGLLGMKERAAMVNGSVRVEGAPGQGTIVRLEISVENPVASDKQSPS